MNVMTLILRRGFTTAGVGVAVGLFAALFLTPLMAGLLYGVAPRDPLTYVSVASLLLAIAAAASAVPAARAAATDPLEALRSE